MGIRNRVRLLMGVNALVYLGPLIAGMAGFGWPAVPVFVAILVLWLILLDPRAWEFSRADWANGRAAVRIAGQVFLQILLAGVLFGIGRGIAGVIGVSLDLPLMQLAAMSFFALPAVRLFWRPDVAANRKVARRMAEKLLDLPDRADDAEILAHLAAMRQHAEAEDLRAALQHLAAREDARLVIRRALAMLGGPALSPVRADG